ncbi:MAG TPA: hypothetical protein VEK57_21545 [Thermoanaerobaculia bacterium]|nr:hypothetical protein [Thermoanaerobaculia bacterium]
MPIRTDTYRFPTAELLVRFFQADPAQPVALAEAAALVGLTREQFREVLDAEGGHAPGDTVLWSEAAAYLFDAWPRKDILELVEAEAGPRIPAGFKLRRVEWWLPDFVVDAMKHQAGQDWQDDPRLRHRLHLAPDRVCTVEDYVADLLYLAITPETVRHLGRLRDFHDAYVYPVVD